MKILICGGHLTPALAVIKALPKQANVAYVGRTHALEGDTAVSLEQRTITDMHIPFIPITTGRVQRAWTRHTIPSLFKLPGGFMQALAIIKKYKPDVILGFGGYVAVPVCIAGWICRIPIVIHEQTLEAGLANKVLVPFATKICISWKSSEKFFPKQKTILTGNPAVSVITPSKQVSKNKQPLLVILGGSLGSHAINLLIEGCLEQLLERYHVLHQIGAAKQFGDFDRLVARKQELPSRLTNNYTPVQFINPENIVDTLQQADLVVSRSGINTVTTLLMLNKPALLIPLPISQHHEQQKNALFFKAHGLGKVANQHSLTSLSLLSEIETMMNKKGTYENKKDITELTIHKAAAQTIIDILNAVCATK